MASGGLRGLIGTLSKDAEDVDTIKVVLETLLLLFVKDELNVSFYHYCCHRYYIAEEVLPVCECG